MRWIIIITIVATIGLLGYAGWQLREPITKSLATINPIVPKADLQFAVVGDNHGTNEIYRTIVGEIKAQPNAFLLNLADTSEHGQVEEFAAVKKLESTLPFPVYHVVGAHDIKTDPSRSTFSSAFDVDPWMSLDIGTLHLVLLDNADRLTGFPTVSLDWLEQDLAAHRAQPTVIAYHRPFDLPLANLLGDDETKTSRASNDRLLSIIKQYPNIRAIFSAHVHQYIPYSLAGIPAYVSGGGGDPNQTIFGGATNNNFHYLTVTVRGSDISVDLHQVTLK